MTRWIDVCAADEVPEGGTLLVRVEGEPVCLYGLEDGVYATHDRCTHANASLADGFIQDGQIECPRIQIQRAEHRSHVLGRECGTMQCEHIAQEIAPGEVMRRQKALGQEGEVSARARLCVRHAEDADRAAVGRRKIEQTLDEGGLAGAVDAHQSEQFSFVHGQAEVGQRGMGAERLANPIEL